MFSKSQWNLYDRLTSGFKRALYQKKELRFMTLTSPSVNGYWFNKKERREIIQKNFDILKKRIKRDLKIDFQYCKVLTDEGYGVLHIIFDGEYIPKDWLDENWCEIHGAVINDIRIIDKDPRQAGFYLIKNYLSNQVCRYGISKNWIYGGWRKDWLELRYKNHDWDKGYYNQYKQWVWPIKYSQFYGAWDLKLYSKMEEIKNESN